MASNNQAPVDPDHPGLALLASTAEGLPPQDASSSSAHISSHVSAPAKKHRRHTRRNRNNTTGRPSTDVILRQTIAPAERGPGNVILPPQVDICYQDVTGEEERSIAMQHHEGIATEGSPVQSPPLLRQPLAPYEFPDFTGGRERRFIWTISLAFICHKHYNIQNAEEFRACLREANSGSARVQRKIRDFARAGKRELDDSLRIFKMLHVLDNSAVQDWRALELFFLFSGGFIGSDAQIPFPPSFNVVHNTIGLLNTISATIPNIFLRFLLRSKLFHSDDTALCFALCTTLHCRLHANLADYGTDFLYERFVPALENVYERLNEAAQVAGCANWAALASPYLFFDIDLMVMSLYTVENRARPEHRISITGETRTELPGYVNATLLEPGRIDARFDLPSDRSRSCEAAVRRAVRRFGDLQREFANHLGEAMLKTNNIPDPLLSIIHDIHSTLVQAFPPLSPTHIIPPPIGCICMSPPPLEISRLVADKLGVHTRNLSDSPDSWSSSVRNGYLHGIPRHELISTEFNHLRLNRTYDPTNGRVRVTTINPLEPEEPVAIVYGFVTHESMKERPILGDVHYGLPGASVSRQFNIRYGLSLDNPQAKLQLNMRDPLFSDSTGTHTCPAQSKVPSWYTLRIVPAFHSVVTSMRRSDPHADPADMLYTREAPTCYMKPLNHTGFDTMKDLENGLAFGVYALARIPIGGECILNPKMRF